MDTQTLRQKILDLAIHGKLVPQDPNDEPAAELLRRIGVEETVDKADYPFEVPESWEWTKLGDYTLSVSDGDHQAPPKSKEGIPFLVISDIANGIIDFTHTRFVSEEYFKSIASNRKVSLGDILFTVTGSYGIVVRVNTEKPFCFQRHIGLIKPSVYGDYLYYVLKSNYIKGICDKKATGTAQKTVGLETLRSMQIPIPPLPEQHHIVSKVEQLFSVIDSIEKSKGKLEDLIEQAKTKILDLAVNGKLVKKTSLWRHCKLGDILYTMETKKPQGDTFNYIDIQSIDNKRNVVSEIKVLPVSKAPSRASRFTEKGDTLFSMVRPYLRNIAMVEDDGCIASTGFFVCRPTEIIDSKYCFYFMLSPYTVDGLNSFLKGDNSPSINKGQVENWEIELPSLAEQHDIVAKVDQLFSVLDRIRDNIQ